MFVPNRSLSGPNFECPTHGDLFSEERRLGIHPLSPSSTSDYSIVNVLRVTGPRDTYSQRREEGTGHAQTEVKTAIQSGRRTDPSHLRRQTALSRNGK